MFFTVELSKGFLSNEKRYRLTESSKWREIKRDEFVIAEDLKVTNPEELKGYIQNDRQLQFNGEIIDVNPSAVRIGDDYFTVRPVLHRKTKPRLFTRDEIERVLVSGYDDRNNVLVITIQGFVELRPNHTGFNDPRVAVRHESFCAGNGYVGPEVLKYPNFITDVYHSLLQAWLLHLRTGKLDIFVDVHEPVNESEIIQEINDELSKLEEILY